MEIKHKMKIANMAYNHVRDNVALAGGTAYDSLEVLQNTTAAMAANAYMITKEDEKEEFIDKAIGDYKRQLFFMIDKAKTNGKSNDKKDK